MTPIEREVEKEEWDVRFVAVVGGLFARPAAGRIG